MVHDVFSNSVLIASFADEASELVFTSTVLAEHYPSAPDVDLVEEYAKTLPFSYDATEMPISRAAWSGTITTRKHRVDAWVRKAPRRTGQRRYPDVLVGITRPSRPSLPMPHVTRRARRRRIQTLDLGSGSCGDFALFMMEAVRSLGLARFVSGYLYDESLIGADGGVVGGGATHAWVQVHLRAPDGCLSTLPTPSSAGATCCAVAVAQDPSQAAPLSEQLDRTP